MKRVGRILYEGTPEWFHRGGVKMTVCAYDPVKYQVVISSTSDAARVVVRPAPARNWIVVEWRIRFSVSTGVEGSIWMPVEECKAAFGIRDDLPKSPKGSIDDHFIRRFGATVAVSGCFIRTGNFLNIPCPGIGMIGDPNVSVLLDDEITRAVGRMLEQAPQNYYWREWDESEKRGG